MVMAPIINRLVEAHDHSRPLIIHVAHTRPLRPCLRRRGGLFCCRPLQARDLGPAERWWHGDQIDRFNRLVEAHDCLVDQVLPAHPTLWWLGPLPLVVVYSCYMDCLVDQAPPTALRMLQAACAAAGGLLRLVRVGVGAAEAACPPPLPICVPTCCNPR